MDIPFLESALDSKLAALCDAENEKFDKKYIDKCIEILERIRQIKRIFEQAMLGYSN